MQHNRYYVPLTSFDKIVEGIGAFALIGCCLVPIMYYYELPEQIPVHFNLAGIPDDYGSRSRILVLPLVAIIIYGLLFLKHRFQHLIRFPVPVTPENRFKLLRLTYQMFRMIRLSVAILFLVMIVSTVQVGLGESKRAGVYYVIYFLLSIAAIIGVYMYRMITLHKDPEEP